MIAAKRHVVYAGISADEYLFSLLRFRTLNSIIIASFVQVCNYIIISQIQQKPQYKSVIKSFLYPGKGQADHRSCSLNRLVFLILPHGKTLEQFSLPGMVHGKKYSSIPMFSVLPKRRGRVIKVTSSLRSHHSRIKSVLST